MKDEIIKQINKLLAKANQMCSEADYREVLDTIGSAIEGRLEGLDADDKESS